MKGYKLIHMLNKKFLWPAVVVVVLLAIFFFSTRRSGQEPAPTPTASPAAGAPAGTQTGTPKTAGTAEQPKYTELIKQYTGRHIQFDQFCQANPNNVTYKNGVTLLFDNRSGDARTIKIDGVAYSFAGFGYRLVTLSKSAGALPYTVWLDCGSAVRVGQILLQN